VCSASTIAARMLAVFTVSVGFGVARLAKREDRPVLAEFGETYMRYARTVPAFISRGRRPQTSVA
jgi:protein-S-isoprenylcysteine O-methyltransferase Ste14